MFLLEDVLPVGYRRCAGLWLACVGYLRMPLSCGLCCLSSAGARLVEAVSGRGVCGCTPIFPAGMTLRPEECNKLARPSFACIVSCVESLVAEKLRLCYTPLIW
jgi:hypothetical protein